MHKLSGSFHKAIPTILERLCDELILRFGTAGKWIPTGMHHKLRFQPLLYPPINPRNVIQMPLAIDKLHRLAQRGMLAMLGHQNSPSDMPNCELLDILRHIKDIAIGTRGGHHHSLILWHLGAKHHDISDALHLDKDMPDTACQLPWMKKGSVSHGGAWHQR